MPKKQALAMATGMVEMVTGILKAGNRVRLSGLGILEVKDRPARCGGADRRQQEDRLPCCQGARPCVPFIPRNVRAAFTLASLAMMTAYTHSVLVLSLGGQVAHDL